MITIIRIPRRFLWAFREGQHARRLQLAAGDPNDLSATYRRAASARAEREHTRKIHRTMHIARRLSNGEDVPAASLPRRRVHR